MDTATDSIATDCARAAALGRLFALTEGLLTRPADAGVRKRAAIAWRETAERFPELLAGSIAHDAIQRIAAE